MKYLKKINEAGKQQSFTKKVCPTCSSTHNLDIDQIRNIFSDFLDITKFSFGHYTPNSKIGTVAVCHLNIDFGLKSFINATSVTNGSLSNDVETIDKIGEIYPCLKRLTDDKMSFGYRITTNDSNKLTMIIFIWETKT